MTTENSVAVNEAIDSREEEGLCLTMQFLYGIA